MPSLESIYKIGVTGSAGSGKSLVCERFGQLGLVVFDCDEIARQVVAPGGEGLAALVERFGKSILDYKGCLERRKLRQIIIRDAAAKREVEAVLHPLIQQRLLHQLKAASYSKTVPAAAVEVPLLFESGMDSLFDTTVVVTSEEVQLVERIRDRDGVSHEDAERLLASQMSQQEKSVRADHVIHNFQNRSQLFESVDKLFDRIQKEVLTISRF